VTDIAAAALRVGVASDEIEVHAATLNSQPSNAAQTLSKQLAGDHAHQDPEGPQDRRLQEL
jgi:hypothetical protein